MANTGYIAEFNMSDGFTPQQVAKLNQNFRVLGGFDTRSAGMMNSRIDDIDYTHLNEKPSIESVELEGNKTFPELGIFKTDQLGYDVSDNYTLSSLDINALWANAVPIGLGA